MKADELIKSFRSDPGRSGFVLDFDGTLSGIVRDPSEVLPVEGAREALSALSETYRVVALLSGRRAENLASIVDVDGLRYLGVYGAEEWRDGTLLQPADADSWRGMASRLARDATAMIASEGLEGTEVEYKDLAVSIHFRNAVNPDAGSSIIEWAETAAPRRKFTAHVGRKVVELRPLGVSKAEAAVSLVASEDLDNLVVAGDDSADVEMLERAGKLLGDQVLRIGVASQEEPAGLREVSDLIVESPEELVGVLDRFA